MAVVESESTMLILLDQVTGCWTYQITKFDLGPHLSTSRSRSSKEEKKKKNRPPPPSRFALSRCSSLGDNTNRPPPPSLSTRSRHHLTLGRFGRYLRVGVRRRRNRNRPPRIPKPLSVPWQGNFPCALGAGVAVLGSKIYIFGGKIPPQNSCFHRGVYMIDASSDSPEMVKLSCELNFGKVTPIVYTIGDKIYALPKSYSSPITYDGREFECFDPQSNSWTVLPDLCKAIEAPSRFEKLEIENPNSRGVSGYQVNGHAVVGSCLVISINIGGGVYTFDTAQPDRGWRRILIVLENDSSPHLLNFLPFDKFCSFPIRDDLVFCSPRVRNYDLELNAHMRRSFKLNINDEDSYVCSFNNPAELSDPKCEFVKVSIHPVTGLDPKQKLKSEDDHENIQFVKNCRSIGDGMVLVSKDGISEYGFDIYQVGRALNSDKDHHHYYHASKIFSATFRIRSLEIFYDITPLVIKGLKP